MEIKAKKSLGQNFLKDENVLKEICENVTTNPNDLIIEIGPGTGALTKYLVNKNSKLICYEIDTRLQDILRKYENKNTKIIYKDILESKITEDIKNIDYERIFIIANIPYYITTPIIKKVMELPKLESMTLLVQKEVAERLASKPGNKSYGSLTVYLSYYFEIEYLFTVKNTCFEPSPKVDSAVISFKKKSNKLKVKSEKILFKLIEDSFKQKRKTLKNNLKEYEWSKILKVLSNNNLSENIRAEELSLETFINISNNL